MVIEREFWRGRRIFITGHTGFKGSWLTLILKQLGAELNGYSLGPPTVPNMYNEANVGRQIISFQGNICDFDNLKNKMQLAQPEIVYHLAAQPLVRLSYDKPVETYSSNVMGTVNVLEAVRVTKSVRAVVVVTTDKCYENREWPWGYREIDPMGGYDPYSSSKACAELITAAYRSSFFSSMNSTHEVALATARAGNVIGGGDWASDRLIPDILTAFETGKRVKIRSPNSIRPWQHVLEPLFGYLILGQRLLSDGLSYAESWNFGPWDRDCRSVDWIINKLAEVWGGGVNWDYDISPKPHEANSLKLDISKARNKLEWHPKWDLHYALKSVVDWRKAWRSGADMHEFTVNQIEEYFHKGSPDSII